MGSLTQGYVLYTQRKLGRWKETWGRGTSLLSLRRIYSTVLLRAVDLAAGVAFLQVETLKPLFSPCRSNEMPTQGSGFESIQISVPCSAFPSVFCFPLTISCPSARQHVSFSLKNCATPRHGTGTHSLPGTHSLTVGPVISLTVPFRACCLFSVR